MIPIQIIPFPRHRKLKKKLLKKIKKTDWYHIEHEDDGPDILGPLTDWDTYEEDAEWPEYFELFMDEVEEDITDIIQGFGLKSIEYTTCWFQQYHKKYEHGWHFHGSTLYHAIYFLELPEGTPATLCKFPGGIEFTPNVQEGDILIIPAIIEHCSPPNASDNRKTIIAVNIDEAEDY